jgi:hypothetical protein
MTCGYIRLLCCLSNTHSGILILGKILCGVRQPCCRFFCLYCSLQTQKPENALSATTFRISSCESVSKYVTLTAFRMNVYRKHEEAQRASRTSFTAPPTRSKPRKPFHLIHLLHGSLDTRGVPRGYPSQHSGPPWDSRSWLSPASPPLPTTSRGKVPGSANYRSGITIALSKPIADDLLQPIPGSTYAQCYRK